MIIIYRFGLSLEYRQNEVTDVWSLIHHNTNVVPGLEKDISRVSFIKSVTTGIPETTLMSWDVFSLVSIMYLFTYTDIRIFWSKCFRPLPDLNRVSDIKLVEFNLVITTWVYLDPSFGPRVVNDLFCKSERHRVKEVAILSLLWWEYLSSTPNS